ncbi:MAG: RNA polymerase sporulation sigma factor SigK [Lachnospiraceae bacterium]|nr:RNA polymerase sporulation sigma factor SigK [Lachnospiraceae bacterium]
MKVFLTPLTPEEESKFLHACQAGDPTARNTLIERNLRLVAHIVKKYQNSGEDLEDLISIGTIGLIKAIDSFDPGRSIRLATYAARCVENELLMHFRKKKKTNRDVSLYEPIGTDREGNEIHLLDIIENNQWDMVELYTQKEEVLQLYVYLKDCLTQREYEILLLRYGLFGKKEMTQQEIAKRLGISRSYVSRIEKNALLKLRHRFLTA